VSHHSQNVGAFLGTTAKFQATCHTKGFQPLASEKIDPETGEILSGLDPSQIRVERYALQAVVRKILPNSRTAKCLRYVQKHKTGVEVWRSTGYKRAHYGGLQTCASVWSCPVCSAKISERRRAELKALIDAHTATGGVVLMVTRTVPHSRTDDLEELLSKITKAEAGYKAHRDYKTVTAAFGLVGTVRAVEVTHGHANGWHPHVHELLFLALPVVLDDLEEDLSRIWKSAAVRAGLEAPSRAHGLTVQDGTYAAKYASKWGLESELTQWHRKRGKVDSRTPFDLLRNIAEKDDDYSAKLFRDYAEAFHGRHQLQFSRGLKKLYQIAEVSDDELVQSQDEDAFLLGSLDLAQWRIVCKAEARGLLLEVAANSDWEGVLRTVDHLRRILYGPDSVPPDPDPNHTH
jgi:translation elongation factor EF-1beta